MKGKYNIDDMDTGETIASVVVEISRLHDDNPCDPDMCEVALTAYYCSLGTVTGDVPVQRLEAVFVNYAESHLNCVKYWLEKETEIVKPTDMTRCVSVRPILHNDGLIILQMLGWSINLRANGTWEYEGTEGG